MSGTPMIEVIDWASLCKNGGLKLLARHREEIIVEDPALPYELDHVNILRLEDAGALLVIWGHLSGIAVGYCIFFISPSLESAGNLCATQGPWFVAPEVRGTGLGLRLWHKAMKELKAKGIRQVLAHAYEGSDPGLAKLFNRKGKPFAKVWSIILEPGT